MTTKPSLREEIIKAIKLFAITDRRYIANTETTLLEFDRNLEDAVDRLEALIRQAMPEKKTDTRGATQNPANPKYSTKYATGFNACLAEVNHILGEKPDPKYALDGDYRP